MRIYRQNVVKNGETITVKKWYCDVRFSGKRYRLPLFEDKKASRDFAVMLGVMCGQYDSGRSYDKRVELWLNQIHPMFLQKFVDWGLLDVARAEGSRPIDDHVKDYLRHLEHKGDTSSHLMKVRGQLKRVIHTKCFRKLSHIDASKIQSFVHDEVQSGRLSQLSGNSYIRAWKSFTGWLYRLDRIDRDPLKNLSMRKVTERKKNRRALSVDEIAYLLDWLANKGEKAYGLAGWERMVLYKLALTSGLRSAELRYLKTGSIDFRGKSVTVPATHTKNRKAATLPLREDVLKDLKELTRGKLPDAQLFPEVTHYTAKMIRRDLDGARKQYNADGGKDKDFLRVKTADGEVDFHALRHTYATLLVNGGTDVKTAQSLLRHASPMITLGIYSHVLRESEQAAIAKLPSFDKMKKKQKKA